MQFQGNKQPAVEMANDTKLTVQVQQPQTPTSDHPSGNDGGRIENDIIVNLYRASVQGDLKAAKDYLRDDENVLRYITPNMETPLHVAIMSRNTKFVGELVDMMSKSELELKNSDGNTAFCLAAISGNVAMAKIMVKKNPKLPIICGTNNMTPPIEEKNMMTPATEKENNMSPPIEEKKKIMPLCLAALHGKRDMVTFLYEQSDKMKDESWREYKNEVLLKCIGANMLDVALQILNENEELPQDDCLMDVLLILAQNPGVFTSPNIISKIRLCKHLAFNEHSVSSSDLPTVIHSLQEVESTLPLRYTQGKNTKGITPEEKFIDGHKEQISKGTDWIYETVNQSMVVAALVCTIGFSIVYSIPGGFDETGYPIFHESNTFFWFVLIEAISFLLSGTSMLIFISIILSRHGHRKEILFERWLAGQEALLASLGSLAMAFLTGVFLIYRNNILPYIISAIAIVLFAIYLEEYITFLLDGFYLTHRSMYLFRLKKYTKYFHSC